MIVDIHIHTWEYPPHFGDDFRRQAERAWGDLGITSTVRYEDYRAEAGEETRTIVFGGKARLSGLWVDDRYVADYVARHPDELIGFLSIDPTREDWERELHGGHRNLGLLSINLLPMYAGFIPSDPLWEYVRDHTLPVLLHTGATFLSEAPLECTLPRHIDTVAIRYPQVKIVLAHLSHPHEVECVVTIRKHPNVYADVSAIHYRPSRLYQSLMLIKEYGVWDKLLFGTDYPFATLDGSLKGLRSLNAMLEGTALPHLDEDQIEAVITHNSLTLLGLE